MLGKVSAGDVDGYCRDQGYTSSGGSEGNYWCYNPGGMQVSLTNVCRWAYPGYPNIKADGNTCKSP